MTINKFERSRLTFDLSDKVAHFFIWFDSLRPSQQFFNYVSSGLPGLKQY